MKHRLAPLMNVLFALGLLATVAGLSAFKPMLPDMLDPAHSSWKEQARVYAAYAKGPTRLFAIGDTGSGNANQKAVADAMYKQQLTYIPKEATASCGPVEGCHVPGGISAVLHMGDVIYPNGQAATDGDRLFNDIYSPMIDMGIPFFLSLGNHDMKTSNGKEVIQAFNVPSGAYYTKHLGLVDVFAINSSAFDMAQQLWLKQALMNSHASWKIVYGHHPLYSTGAHGHDHDLVQLRGKLEPILTNYNADAYLAGHDHNYERFAQKALPYLHIVSGGGGAYLRTKRKMPSGQATFPKTAHYAIKYHYLDLSITPEALTIQARDVNNTVFDTVKLTK